MDTILTLRFVEGGPAVVDAGRVRALSAAAESGNARVELKGADEPRELDERWEDAVRRVDEVLRRTGRRLEAEEDAGPGWRRPERRRVVRPHRCEVLTSDDGLLRIFLERGQYGVEQNVWVCEGFDPVREWRHMCWAQTEERLAEVWEICTGAPPELP